MTLKPGDYFDIMEFSIDPNLISPKTINGFSIKNMKKSKIA